MDRIDPIAPDRSVQRVDPTYLTPLEREREKERREQQRERRKRTPQVPASASEGAREPRLAAPQSASDEAPPRLDVRA